MNISLSKSKLKYNLKYKTHVVRISKVTFWFLVGAALALISLTSFGFLAYEKIYENKVYPGIYVNNVDFGGKTKEDVKNYFDEKNKKFGDTTFVLSSDYGIATISAKEINFGYDTNLSSEQTYTLGRSGGIFSNFAIMIEAYVNGVRLPPGFTYDQKKLEEILAPIASKIKKDPVAAVFTFENNRVTTFKPSSVGQVIDIDALNKKLIDQALTVTSSKNSQVIIIPVPIKILQPNITTEKVNNLGIKELIGSGHSLFFHSIPGRIFNVNLAATRINGILVPPNEVFSFDKALGDVSAFTGYKQAYVIQNGHTVLGDGGGVCQVSTTFFRALLDAGLPIVERHGHAYRVGYYEEDSPPGIDATIFVPSVDLKFKNDTGHYILIQSVIDLNNLSLDFYLYGTKDGRQVTMTTPVVTSQTAPPPPLYQDDPNLPIGQIQQTDFEAWGANVYFTRKVTKDGKVLLSDTFSTHYQPWQAVYLRGTKPL